LKSQDSPFELPFFVDIILTEDAVSLHCLMSLSQPLTARESANVNHEQVDGSTDHDGEGTFRQRLRRLSTDAFATTNEAIALGQEPAPHTAAYKVSPARRAGMYCVCPNSPFVSAEHLKREKRELTFR
jgi:hypothetical protein